MQTCYCSRITNNMMQDILNNKGQFIQVPAKMIINKDFTKKSHWERVRWNHGEVMEGCYCIPSIVEVMYDVWNNCGRPINVPTKIIMKLQNGESGSDEIMEKRSKPDIRHEAPSLSCMLCGIIGGIKSTFLQRPWPLIMHGVLMFGIQHFYVLSCLTL